MAFVSRGFEAADLLLGCIEFAREVFLGKAGPFAQGRKLQGHVPSLTSAFKALGKDRVFQLFFQVKVKVSLFHVPNRSCQSRIRSSAVSRSRAGVAWPLFRMP